MLRTIDSLSKDAQIIKDPAIEPFFIVKMKGQGFAVLKPSDSKKGKDKYFVVEGYPSNFSYALRMIAKAQLDTSKKDYDTIKEYLEEWHLIKERMETLTGIYD